ncbi:MAG: VWA domain-containing protein [Polyangiaceae bacterium]|jgi:Ca-activated chloride channel family protein|nr:VWA domain-containing protein [Polyangiaceae bacterium]
MSASFELHILPEHEALAYNEREGRFVLAVKPPAAPSTRPPLRLVLALDTSGSMHGEKLQTAVASARAVVRSLGPSDAFACVAFSSRVRELLPMTPMDAAGKQRAFGALDEAKASGNTNLGGAMLTSLELCRGKGRVLLLTDGCPTEGVTGPDQLLRLVQGAASGATLSAFGFGRDVNPLLLSSLAEQGRGNYTFIEAGEPPVEAIAAEVGGLLMTTAANLRLALRPSPGVKIEQVLRAGDVRLDSGNLLLELPALVAEEEVFLPLSLRWEEAALGGVLAVVSAQAYSVETGQLLQEQASLLPTFSSARGAYLPAAAREILLGRAAMALRKASQAVQRASAELAAEIGALGVELQQYASRAGISADPQVSATLATLEDTRLRLLSNGEAQRSVRQDMVGTSVMLSRKRSTMMGLKDSSQAAAQKAFTTRAQSAGIDLIKKMFEDK